MINGSWLTVPKTLGISCDRNCKGPFYYVNNVTFGKPFGNLKTEGMVSKGTSLVISVELQGEERGWRWMANNLINLAYIVKPP